MNAPARPDVRAAGRFRLIGVTAPMAAALLLAVAQAALLARVPGTVAIHWGASGAADGFGPAWTYPVLTLATGVLTPVLLGMPVLRAIRRRSGAARARALAAAIWFVVGLVGGLSLGALLAQIGIEDPSRAPSILPALVVAAVVALGIAHLAWFLTIDPPVVPGDKAQPDPIGLAPGERAVWLREVRFARPGRIAVLGLLVLLVAGTVVLVMGDLLIAGRVTARAWTLAAPAVLVGLLLLAVTQFRVRIDEAGVAVRSSLGWPRAWIPASEIADARVVAVSAMGEYGGYGWRYAAGAGTGIVMRAGEALRITRRDGRMLTITVDDAETGVALLRGLRERSEG